MRENDEGRESETDLKKATFQRKIPIGFPVRNFDPTGKWIKIRREIRSEIKSDQKLIGNKIRSDFR